MLLTNCFCFTGIITSYALIQNGIKIQESTAMSRTVTGLTPWSLQVFRVEACTSKGCSFGPEASARTQEAPPQGEITLMVIVDDARTVNARWTAPESPNGFMIYEVMFTGLYYVDPGKCLGDKIRAVCYIQGWKNVHQKYNFSNKFQKCL